MVTNYDKIRDEDGNLIKGRTHLFINSVRDDGEILNAISGPRIVPEGSGTLFVVDEWLVSQIDKLLFIDGGLAIKDGEELEVPVKSETELKREELLKQLAELDAQ